MNGQLVNGRCCGRKPVEMTQPRRHYLCGRCHRTYDIRTCKQTENWAWRQVDGKWRRV